MKKMIVLILEIMAVILLILMPAIRLDRIDVSGEQIHPTLTDWQATIADTLQERKKQADLLYDRYSRKLTQAWQGNPNQEILPQLQKYVRTVLDREIMLESQPKIISPFESVEAEFFDLPTRYRSQLYGESAEHAYYLWLMDQKAIVKASRQDGDEDLFLLHHPPLKPLIETLHDLATQKSASSLKAIILEYRHRLTLLIRELQEKTKAAGIPNLTGVGIADGGIILQYWGDDIAKVSYDFAGAGDVKTADESMRRHERMFFYPTIAAREDLKKLAPKNQDPQALGVFMSLELNGPLPYLIRQRISQKKILENFAVLSDQIGVEFPQWKEWLQSIQNAKKDVKAVQLMRSHALYKEFAVLDLNSTLLRLSIEKVAPSAILAKKQVLIQALLELKSVAESMTALRACLTQPTKPANCDWQETDLLATAWESRLAELVQALPIKSPVYTLSPCLVSFDGPGTLDKSQALSFAPNWVRQNRF